MEMTKEKSGSEDGNAEILLSSEGYEHLLDEVYGFSYSV